MRQIVLDTETTGLEPKQGHRIIEIGCVEVVGRKLTGNHYHQYIQPNREIDEGAIEVHGITNEFLQDKPCFEDIAEDFLNFIKGAELVIHNAPFDVGFINHEFNMLKPALANVETNCKILDTLQLARQMHPGQRNSLDALCKRYDIDNSQREKHGALLDSEILADVYLAMTGGQVSLGLGMAQDQANEQHTEALIRLATDRPPLRVISASADELKVHQEYLQSVDKASGGQLVWKSE